MSIQLNWTPIISVTNSYKVLNFHTIWSSWTWNLVVERCKNKTKYIERYNFFFLGTSNMFFPICENSFKIKQKCFYSRPCQYFDPKILSFQVCTEGQNNTYWNPNQIICLKIYIGANILPATSSRDPDAYIAQNNFVS